MREDVLRIVRMNQSPMWMIVFFYVAALLLFTFGSVMMWSTWQAGIGWGVSTAFAMLMAGIGIGRDAGHRLAVNRLLDEVRVALDRVD